MEFVFSRRDLMNYFVKNSQDKSISIIIATSSFINLINNEYRFHIERIPHLIKTVGNYQDKEIIKDKDLIRAFLQNAKEKEDYPVYKNILTLIRDLKQSQNNEYNKIFSDLENDTELTNSKNKINQVISALKENENFAALSDKLKNKTSPVEIARAISEEYAVCDNENLKTSLNGYLEVLGFSLDEFPSFSNIFSKIMDVFYKCENDENSESLKIKEKASYIRYMSFLFVKKIKDLRKNKYTHFDKLLPKESFKVLNIENIEIKLLNLIQKKQTNTEHVFNSLKAIFIEILFVQYKESLNYKDKANNFIGCIEKCFSILNVSNFRYFESLYKNRNILSDEFAYEKIKKHLSELNQKNNRLKGSIEGFLQEENPEILNQIYDKLDENNEDEAHLKYKLSKFMPKINSEKMTWGIGIRCWGVEGGNKHGSAFLYYTDGYSNEKSRELLNNAPDLFDVIEKFAKDITFNSKKDLSNIIANSNMELSVLNSLKKQYECRFYISRISLNVYNEISSPWTKNVATVYTDARFKRIENGIFLPKAFHKNSKDYNELLHEYINFDTYVVDKKIKKAAHKCHYVNLSQEDLKRSNINIHHMLPWVFAVSSGKTFFHKVYGNNCCKFIYDMLHFAGGPTKTHIVWEPSDLYNYANAIKMNKSTKVKNTPQFIYYKTPNIDLWTSSDLLNFLKKNKHPLTNETYGFTSELKPIITKLNEYHKYRNNEKENIQTYGKSHFTKISTDILSDLLDIIADILRNNSGTKNKYVLMTIFKQAITLKEKSNLELLENKNPFLPEDYIHQNPTH